MIRATRTTLLGLILAIAAMVSNPALMQAAPPAITTHAEAAALIDVKSGRILYSKQGDKQMLIASLTKIMTAIVAIEHGKLSDTVKVSKNAFGKEGSSLYLKLGEEMSLQHMLYGMMLRSGNDAATAIAEHIGGTVEGFAYMMNEEADLIGMEHTHFMNPTGLNQEGHYSTANDMAKLVAYALKNPVFQEIVKTKEKTAPNPNQPWDYKWKNKNKMLEIFDGADGVKTGYTKLAKRCLASSATRGGQQLAVITLNDPDDWADHTRLLDYGFRYYPLDRLIEKGEAVDMPAIRQYADADTQAKTERAPEAVAGTTFFYALAEGEKEKIGRSIVPADTRSAAYRLGELGRLEFSLNGQTIGSVPLYAKGDPRLSRNEQAAFSFKEGEAYSYTLYERYQHLILTLLRSLFNPAESGWE
jgi:D-alanyl-D-alanine carboxypeptidase